MRIAVNAQLLTTGSNRGIGVYLSSVLIPLIRSMPKCEFYVYVVDASVFSFPNNTKPLNLKIRTLPNLGYPIIEQFIIPIFLLLDKIKILWSPANTSPILLPPACTLITTIHDVSFCYSKKHNGVEVARSLYQKLGKIYRSATIYTTARKSSYIITVSKWAKSEICTNLNVNTNKIIVAYHGVEIPSKSSTSNRNILCFLGAAPHKNSFLFLSAAAEIDWRATNAELHVVGIDRSYSEIPPIALNCPQIHFHGHVSGLQLQQIQNNSFAVINPSLSESFGLPNIEALAAGKLLAASNVGAVPEIVGTHAFLFDPWTKDGINKGINHLLHADPHDISHKTTSGQSYVSKFSWKSSVSIHRSVLIRALSHV